MFDTKSQMNFYKKALLILFVAAIACEGDLQPPAGGEVTVITTTYPLTFLSETIGLSYWKYADDWT